MLDLGGKYESSTDWTCLQDLLEIAQLPIYHDVTIICLDGKINVNSFLLANIFPIVQHCYNLTGQQDEPTIISLPGLDIQELSKFFSGLYSMDPVMKLSSSLAELLKKPDVSIKQELEIIEDTFNDDGDCMDVVSDFEGDDLSHSIEKTVSKKVRKKQKKSHVDMYNNDTFYDDSNADLIDEENNFESKAKSKKNKGEKELKCAECGKIFNKSSSFKRHVLVHKGINRDNVSCTNCGKKFRNKKSLQNHIDKCVIAPIACDICGKVIPNKLKLRRHVAGHAIVEKKKIIPEGHQRCNLCKKDIPIAEVSQHVCATHPCDVCGRMFTQVNILNVHKKTVHEKMYSERCEICGHECKYAGQLKRHMLIHTQELIECTQCNTKVRNLEKHIARMHTSDENKEHQCQECGKGFITKRTLNIHQMNVHLKLRPYECRYGCSFRYNDLSNRNAHEKKTHGQIFSKAGFISVAKSEVSDPSTIATA